MKWENRKKVVGSRINANLGYIHQICGRVHCARSHYDAVREVLRAMTDRGRKEYFSMDRWTKRGFVRAIIYHHRQNQQTYCDVMGGNLNLPKWIYTLQKAKCLI